MNDKQILETLTKLFLRDLKTLQSEIDAYENEENIWIVAGNIRNSGGNLALHLVGNLNHFVGTLLGNTGYVRQRDLEFSQKGVPAAELISMIDDTSSMIEETLLNMDTETLGQNYPIRVFSDEMTVLYFLQHLAGHLSYHLGQVNYHRRLLDN